MSGKRTLRVGIILFLCIFMQNPAFPSGEALSASADMIVAGASDRRPAADPVAGACGTAHGKTVASAPATNLCTAGTSSSVSGAGPWSWQCAGTDGGSTADCIAAIVPLDGDVNGDRAVNLADAILTLKVVTGAKPSGIPANYQDSDIDTNGDGQIGMSDIIYILQRIADLRMPSDKFAVGSVTLPAGSTLTFADVRVQSFMGKAAVQANGTYSVLEPSTGLAIVILTDLQGRTMLMGYADAGDPQMGKISPLSTVTAS